VHRVGTELLPPCFDIGGDVHHARVASEVRPGIGFADGDRLVAVVLPQRGAGRHVAIAETSRAAGGNLAAAAHGDLRSTRLARSRSHPDRATADFERLAGPGRAQRLDHLDRATGALGHRTTEHGELALHVAVGDDEIEPAATDLIDDGDVFCQTDGIVEGRDQRSDVDSHVRRARGDRRGQRQRARQVTVRRAVMLRQHDGQEAVPISPLRHLDRGLIPVCGGNLGERWVAQIEPYSEQCHGSVPP
jgi:hypothetical protein